MIDGDDKKAAVSKLSMKMRQMQKFRKRKIYDAEKAIIANKGLKHVNRKKRRSKKSLTKKGVLLGIAEISEALASPHEWGRRLTLW